MNEKWVRKYDFDRQCKEYAVNCFVLMDDEGYLAGEYEITIRSWHDDLYIMNAKVADCFSEHRYKMTFRDKHEANRMWAWIIKNEPNYEQLKAAGFKHSTW